MSRKHFYWLLLLTVALSFLALVFPGRIDTQRQVVQTALIPGLAEQVNNVAWVRLTSAGGEPVATLRRENDAWVVEEVSAYRADWDRVRTLLSALAEAEIVEEKTSKPEYYARLGVEDVSSDEAAGVLVEFAVDSGLSAVIIGNSAQGRDGQYARLAGSEKSVLIDSSLDLSKDRSDWLNKNIIDVSDAEVVEYEIEHPDGASVKAVKTSADDESFELLNIPSGREIRSEQVLDAPARSLASLVFQSVVPAEQLSWEGVAHFRILTADGLTIDSELMTVQSGDEGDTGQEHWLRLNAGVYTTSVDSVSDREIEDSETYARAEEINGRVAGWAYRIPAYSYDAMSRHIEDLLQPVEDENESPSL